MLKKLFISILSFFIFSNILLFSAVRHMSMTNSYNYDGPPIKNMSPSLLDVIHDRARELSYIEELSNHFRFQGLYAYGIKTNAGDMLNMAQVGSMNIIFRHMIGITNSDNTITLTLGNSNQNNRQPRGSHGFGGNEGPADGHYNIGSKWPWQNTAGWFQPARNRYVVRYYFNNVPQNHRAAWVGIMNEIENINSRIEFKNVNDDLGDIGQPRFRIERHGGSDNVDIDFAHVTRLGSGFGTSVLRYDPWGNPSLNDVTASESEYSKRVRKGTVTFTTNYISRDYAFRDGQFVLESGPHTFATTTTTVRTTCTTLNGYNSDNDFKRMARHELGHILGFIHEFQRDDRNNHVDYDSCNGRYTGSQYAPFTDSINVTDYDHYSVMNYNSFGCGGENSFDINCLGGGNISRTHENTYNFLRKTSFSPFIDGRIIYEFMIQKFSSKDKEAIRDLYR